jgi:hypothetical protein
MNVLLASDQLTGALWLTPGQGAPRNLRSTRPALAPHVAPGQSAAALPGLLSSLFTLCGHAHRICSRLSIAAAAPQLPAPQAASPADSPAEELRRETASEHLRRIALDWPRLLSSAPTVAAQALYGLKACPLLKNPQTPADWNAACEWLSTQWLDMPPAVWLKGWQEGGSRWLDDWARGSRGWLPALLREARANDVALPPQAVPALRVQARADDLRELARALRDEGEGFAVAPRWRGRCAHTGVWSRLRDTQAPPLDSACALLGSRMAELARLCLPRDGGIDGCGADWLQSGSLSTGPGRGLAWVEMARGLLVHQVELEGLDARQPGQARVTSCQVLAPTEWNFHPEGIAAQALAGLRPGPRVDLLMAALDPCVPFRLDSPAPHERGAGQARHA